MRNALRLERLKHVYAAAAGHYDFEHALLTARSDQRGRRLIVEHAVEAGDRVLDCGAGTGSTAMLAASKAGSEGRVTLFDVSEQMLAEAKAKGERAGLVDRLEFRIGDMVRLPFEDDSFDAVLSSYSICPLYDPVKGALEMLRVLKPGGLLGAAHSTEPENRLLRWAADAVESAVWHLPSVSLGCRAVSVLPALEAAGARLVYRRTIGVPLWPFLVLVVEKPSERP